MTHRHRTITATPQAEAILEDLGRGAASRYLCGLVRDAERDWLRAVAALRAHRWTDDGIAAVARALGGQHLSPMSDADHVRGILFGADVLHGAGRGVPRWEEMLRELERGPVLAAVLVVGREWWRHNRRLRRMLGGDDG